MRKILMYTFESLLSGLVSDDDGDALSCLGEVSADVGAVASDWSAWFDPDDDSDTDEHTSDTNGFGTELMSDRVRSSAGTPFCDFGAVTTKLAFWPSVCSGLDGTRFMAFGAGITMRSSFRFLAFR
jgi:hypothetical protein